MRNRLQNPLRLRILTVLLAVLLLPTIGYAIIEGSAGPVNLPPQTPCTSVGGTYRVTRNGCTVDMSINECVPRPGGGCQCSGEVINIVSGGGPWGPCDEQPTTGGPVWTLY